MRWFIYIFLVTLSYLCFMFLSAMLWMILESGTASFNKCLKCSKLFSGILCSSKYEKNLISALVIMSHLLTAEVFLLDEREAQNGTILVQWIRDVLCLLMAEISALIWYLHASQNAFWWLPSTFFNHPMKLSSSSQASLKARLGGIYGRERWLF